ncbi:hypothetical protein QR680_008440 [Steinernema hermaphroditum]|uniref:Uncharacterized protein n=1 Tax=Steinernema hermaphroditum TaxID=289476 RepID=A0AA39IHY4_9BILA|nr:hypothetical protein QR680_008433 [Steinernema hermaphroditum]KAK0423975.1 hypothetical protein QR680_008440 [Steinernema hermaphroditum]
MESEESSWSGSSFTTASPCSLTVASFGTFSDVDMDSEDVSLTSGDSCRTGVEPLELVDSLVLLRERCTSAGLCRAPSDESEETMTLDSEDCTEVEFSDYESEDTQMSSEALSSYQMDDSDEKKSAEEMKIDDATMDAAQDQMVI